MMISKFCSLSTVLQLVMILGGTTIVTSSSKLQSPSGRKGIDNWNPHQRISRYRRQDSFIYSSSRSTYSDDQLLHRDSASSNFETNAHLSTSLNQPNLEHLSPYLMSNGDGPTSGIGHPKQILEEWGNHPTMEGVDQHSSSGHTQDSYSGYVGLQTHSDYHQSYPQPMYQHHHHHQEEEKESIEVEDKVFSKTIVATKALKAGNFIFTFFMVLVVFALAGLAKLGVSLSPAILPLALFPLGVIALLLFIPLFIIFVPIVASGLAGGKKRRRRRSIAFTSFETELDKYIIILQQVLKDELNHIIIKIRA